MGLSTKQVSSDGHNGWDQSLLQGDDLELPKSPSLKRQSSSQQQQQQHEPLKCPRCDSTNTKFCYYNNYNKSQPRHFCKACKRHWTKGGTLRNVPVGGGRKNKRLKTSNPASKPASKPAITTATTTTTTTSSMAAVFCGMGNSNSMKIQPLTLGTLGGINDKSFTEAFYQTVGRQPPCSLTESSITFAGKSLDENSNGVFLGSSLNDQELKFPYSNLGNFENNPCSISSKVPSIQSSNLYNYTGEAGNGVEETGMNSLNTSLSSSSMSDHHQQPWTVPTSIVMDMPTTNWGWDDFDKFVSVDADLTIPWDDAEINP